jgi:hypothetical protein
MKKMCVLGIVALLLVSGLVLVSCDFGCPDSLDCSALNFKAGTKEWNECSKSCTKKQVGQLLADAVTGKITESEYLSKTKAVKCDC